MRLSLVLAGCLVAAPVVSGQSTKGFQLGTYAFLPRTASYDPQFDSWRMQVVPDSFRVLDPDGAVFLVSVAKMAGDTLQWTDVAGPCTGVVSRYKLSRDSIGIMLDLIDDACADRAEAVVHMYFTPAKAASGDTPPADRPRRYTRLVLMG